VLRTVVLRWVHLAGEAEKKGVIEGTQKIERARSIRTHNRENKRVRISETKPDLQSSETPAKPTVHGREMLSELVV
jgi:hypothetical protein